MSVTAIIAALFLAVVALVPKPRGLNMGQALWHLLLLYLLPSVTIGVLAAVALIRKERLAVLAVLVALIAIVIRFK